MLEQLRDYLDKVFEYKFGRQFYTKIEGKELMVYSLIKTRDLFLSPSDIIGYVNNFKDYHNNILPFDKKFGLIMVMENHKEYGIILTITKY